MLTARPPVVTVLGHVDHGESRCSTRSGRRTSRQAKRAASRRRSVRTPSSGTIARSPFVDTPGHEAFTAMRARGAKVTDVAILVVAADDGVMPQTKEAIAHVQAANVPIVVAINKIDRPDAQPDRVKQQLVEQGLQPVDWAAASRWCSSRRRPATASTAFSTPYCSRPTSANCVRIRPAAQSGVVIESALHRGRGAVATVLVQNGTLRVGDIVVAGGTFGKVRALIDDKGRRVKKAGPSHSGGGHGPLGRPAAGDTLSVVSDERVARETAEKRATRRRDVRMAATGTQRVSLETFMSMPAEGGKVLNLIIKADGQGSLEALRARMESLSTDDVEIRVIHGGVGAISPNDVNLAAPRTPC